MSTTTKSQLDEAQAEYDASLARFEAAKAATEAERAAAEQRRAKAHEQFDRQTLAEYDPAPYDAEVEAARAALTEALLADPLHQAIIRVNVAEYLRTDAVVDRNAAAARLGTDMSSDFVRAPSLVAADDLTRLIEREVGRRVADLLDAREQERVDVGEKAAKRRN